MLTLIVRQSLKNGAAKTWKLRSNNSTQTFGASRLADVISISPQSKGIQGLFEFREGHWWYIDLDMNQSPMSRQAPALRLDKESSLELADCTLNFTPIQKEADLFLRLEGAREESLAAAKKLQLFIVKQNGRVVETKLLPLTQKFKPLMALTPMSNSSIPSNEWQILTQGNLEIRQKTVSLEDAARLARLSADQIVDEESKKSVYILLGAALFLVTVGIF